MLAAVTPGRVVRVDLARDLRDPDGQLALDVVRHFHGARAALGHHGRWPLTEATFQAVARKRGRTVGIKRSRRLIRRLVEAGVIEQAGSYRQRYRNAPGSAGYRVRLYRLGARVRGVLRSALRGKRPVGSRSCVKRVQRPRWWEHPLFGTPDGLPPPELTKAQRRRMKSADERDPRQARA